MAERLQPSSGEADTRSLTQRVTEQISLYIQQQGLQPGDKLPNEYELAQLLSVGRSTIREAIKALIARNVLEIHRGAGTYVAPNPGVADDPLGLAFIPDKLQMAKDLLAVRCLIEPAIAGMAAQHATDEEIAQLTALCDEMEQLIAQKQSHLQKDIEFHTLIAQCSRNCVVSNLLPIINRAIIVFMTINLNAASNAVVRETNHYHRAILQAIAQHDAMAAQNAMLVHLASNQKNLQPPQASV